ncbi:MAG TPA: MFS transporter [Candidatus Limnocylindria bacterium]
MSTARRTRRLPGRLAAVAAVLDNRSLRRVFLAFFAFSLAEWTTWIAILVHAYAHGGATETGVAALVQLAPSAAVAPIAATIGDHVPRERALLFAYLAQAVTMLLTGVALAVGAPSPVIYAAAATVATSITLTRPVQAAMLPSLSRTPSELTAANVASGSLETAAMLLGPVAAGLLLAATGEAVVFVASAAVVVGCAFLVARVAPVVEKAEVAQPRTPGIGSLLREAFAGFALVTQRGRQRPLLLLLGAAAVIWGALDVLLVVLAFDLLGLGEAGVGYLNAAIGAGGLLGAAVSVILIGRNRLALPFVAGMLLWSLPLTLLGVLPSLAGALLLLAAAGMGRLLLDVSGRTLLQRVAPERLLSRAFGVLEGINMGSLAVGSIVAPALIALAGPRGAFAVAGGLLLAVTLLSWRGLRAVDQVGIARPRELALLRAIPIFAPLDAPALERLAANLLPVHAHDGSVVVRQGEPGDHFYLIVDGRFRVLVDGREVRELGPGESFGEIALLRDVPRTATVEASGGGELLTLERRVFIEAVTGHASSAETAEKVVADRLAAG